MLWVAGKPDAGELVARRPDAGELVVCVACRVAGAGEGAGECCEEEVKCAGEGPAGLSGGSAAVAKGSCVWRIAAGVSTNMMEGPEASSVATAVRGTGLEENLGRDSGSVMTGAREEEEICEAET
jgi:hypothetical protein